MESEGKKQEETIEEKLLGKFKTADELAKAYQELERKLGSKQLNDTDSVESAFKKQEEFFGKLMKGESSLDGELGKISKQISGDLKLPAHYTDAAVAKAAAAVAGSSVESRKKAVEEYMDEDKRAQLGAILGNGKEAEEFNARHNKGEVSVKEIELMLKEGAQKENTAGIERTGKPPNAEEAWKQLEAIYDNPLHPALNPSRQGHAEAYQEMQRLKSLIGE